MTRAMMGVLEFFANWKYGSFGALSNRKAVGLRVKVALYAEGAPSVTSPSHFASEKNRVCSHLSAAA